MSDDITTAIDFVEKIRKEDIVSVKFIKKDGTERIMKCTLSFDRIPKADRPKDVSLKKIMDLIKKHNQIHVYDLDKNLWRSLPFDRAEWLETKDHRRFNIMLGYKRRK